MSMPSPILTRHLASVISPKIGRNGSFEEFLVFELRFVGKVSRLFSHFGLISAHAGTTSTVHGHSRKIHK